VGGGFALWRWMVDQKWRRVQYAQSLIHDFLDKETTQNAFEILDVSNESTNLQISDQPVTVKITDDLLIDALALDFNTDENDQETLQIRTILDDFLADLSLFQNHIDAGLIKLNDVRPYLKYWVGELTGDGRIQQNRDVGLAVAAYCRKFGYDPLLKLGRCLGSPFPNRAHSPS
jgi:hypothetical protein